MRTKYYSYDEAFKELMRYYFEPIARIITDYELLDLPKRLDILIIEADKPLLDYVKIFTYFKRYNIIEFKSEKDRFVFNEDLYKLGIYINGIFLKEKEANYENTTFSLVTTLKPLKLIKTFNAINVQKAIYRIDNISIIPINIIVIEELDIDFEKEIKILKEFTSKKDRKQIIEYQIKDFKNNSIDINKLLDISLGLYFDELTKISKKAGIKMTQIEENYTKAAVMFGLKDKWLQEGKLEGKMEGILEGKMEGILEGKMEGILEGKMEGILEGKMEGIQEGRLEGKMEAIINMVTLAWKNKYSIDDILKITNLSKEDIIEIINNHCK